jgi:hypothetical protein
MESSLPKDRLLLKRVAVEPLTTLLANEPFREGNALLAALAPVLTPWTKNVPLFSNEAQSWPRALLTARADVRALDSSHSFPPSST